MPDDEEEFNGELTDLDDDMDTYDSEDLEEDEEMPEGFHAVEEDEPETDF